MEESLSARMSITYVGKLKLSRALKHEEVSKINPTIGTMWELDKTHNGMELYITNDLKDEYSHHDAYGDLMHIMGCLERDVRVDGMIQIFNGDGPPKALEVINNGHKRRIEMVQLKLIFDRTEWVNDVDCAY